MWECLGGTHVYVSAGMYTCAQMGRPKEEVRYLYHIPLLKRGTSLNLEPYRHAANNPQQ